MDEFADPPKRKRGRKPKAKADIPLSPTPMSPKTKVRPPLAQFTLALPSSPQLRIAHAPATLNPAHGNPPPALVCSSQVKRKKGDPSVADEKMYQAARAAATQRLVVSPAFSTHSAHIRVPNLPCRWHRNHRKLILSSVHAPTRPLPP